MSRPRLAVWALCVSLSALLPARGARPEGTERLKIEWHRVLLGEQPAGYMSVRERPRDEGGYRLEQYMKVLLTREKTPIEIEVSMDLTEDEKGRVLGFTMDQKMSARATKLQGTVEGASLRLETRVGSGPPRVQVVPYDRNAVGPHREEALARERLKDEGDSLEQTVFFPELGRCGKRRATLGPYEPVKIGSETRRLRRVDYKIDSAPGLSQTAWVDDDFQVWKTAMPFLGAELVTLRSSQGEIAAEDFSSPPEIFVASAVPLREKLPPRPREATYRLRLKRGKFGAGGVRVAEGAGQSLVRQESEGVAVIKVEEVLPGRSRRLPIAATEELEASLQPNSYIQSDDARVLEISRQAVGDEKDALEAARRINRWVHENLREKNLGTAFATAAEVASRLEGDCTEHAVLLAAMARAAGIPARVVAGLVYHESMFFGHMWTEVYVDRWVPLDATRGLDSVAADHIALARSSLHAATISELFLDICATVGNLEIELLSARER